MILWIVLGVLLLFFIFVAYKSTDVWNPAHIALAAGIFVMSLVFVFLAAASLKTRDAWMKQYVDLTQQLEQQQQRTITLSEGLPLDTESRRNSIRGLTEELDRVIQLRGQVWRNMRPVGAVDGGFALNALAWGDDALRQLGQDSSTLDDAPAAEGETDAPAAPVGPRKPHGIQEQTLVHAFAELPLKPEMLPEAALEPILSLLVPDRSVLEKDEKGAFRVPFIYLGEFMVAKSEANGLVVVPTHPMSEQQVVMAGKFSWALYDSMPADSHDVFRGATQEQLAALFGTMMNAPPPATMPLVAQYLRDGQDAQESDPDDRKWFEIKFVKEHQVEVDVPADGESSLPERPFDVTGRARDASLRHGTESVTLQPDQQAVFDRFTTEKLVAAQVAQVTRPVYLRRLRDYAYEIRSDHVAFRSMNDRMGVTQRNIAILDQSLEMLKQQIQYRSDEKDRLGNDLAAFGREQQVLQTYLANTQARIDELRQTLKTLYLNNNRVAESLAQ